MALSNDDRVKFIRAVLAEHEALWQERQAEMRRYKSVYTIDFYKEKEIFGTHGQIRVEVADAYAYVEGYIASLFSKAPAVEVGADVQGKGNLDLVKEVANRFLYDQRTQLELASRLALIYPNAFVKLYPRDATNMLESVGMKAVAPWEIIVDRDACDWSEQRYVGHIYYESIAAMDERFGRKRWVGIKKTDYFSEYGGSASDPYLAQQADSLPNQFLYCKVVELYDFVNGELYFWTPNWSEGNGLLERGPIPLESHDGSKTSAIIPLYYSRVPDQPLDGLSAMKRIYDQVYEKNILRSFWANAVRRDTRQYLVREGAIDEESLAKITAGIDGAMIPVDAENLAGLMSVVPNAPISSNHAQYLGQIEADLAKGSVLAPFTRGETTKASATEIAALAQYTASEIGRLARERDQMIEHIADAYINILSLVIEEGTREVILLDGSPEIITSDKLQGKFKYSALDQASTPIAESVRRQQLLQLVPVLTQLGVDPAKIRDEVIRLYDLPRVFSEATTPTAAPEDMPKAGPDGTPFSIAPPSPEEEVARQFGAGRRGTCLLYTSDAADD